MSQSKINRRQFSLHAGQWLTGLAMLSPSLHAVAQAPARQASKVPVELGAFGQAAAWQMQGTGALRFFGFKAYDANLWSAGTGKSNPLTDKSLFALEIVYNTGIKADEIVNVSLIEMARLKKLTDAQIKGWTADMQRTFPNVVQGDRLTGFLPSGWTKAPSGLSCARHCWAWLLLQQQHPQTIKPNARPFWC
jgi:hypothetical protein